MFLINYILKMKNNFFPPFKVWILVSDSTKRLLNIVPHFNNEDENISKNWKWPETPLQCCSLCFKCVTITFYQCLWLCHKYFPLLTDFGKITKKCRHLNSFWFLYILIYFNNHKNDPSIFYSEFIFGSLDILGHLHAKI